MGGLVSFIRRVKNCSNDLEEEQKVEQELAKIRTKLANKGLSGYRRKKNVWKLIYINMIGYSVDLGHNEAAFLINSERFSEKMAGYVSISILYDEESSSRLDVAINSIKGDLAGDFLAVKSAVVGALANITFKNFIHRLYPIIAEIAFTTHYSANTLQRKALCCLSMYLKKEPSIFQETWVDKLEALLRDYNVGSLLAATTFLKVCIKVKGIQKFGYMVDILIDSLKNLTESSTRGEYVYYGIVCPWLQVRLLQILQLFPFPTKTDSIKSIQTSLSSIITRVEVGSSINKNNSEHSILFEAINLILYYNQNVISSLRMDVLRMLNKYIGVREPNVRYLALESMARIEPSSKASEAILSQRSVILVSLRDPDPSIRRRALDVLFALCNKQLAPEIVDDLLDYLSEKDVYLKEELILKIALLAEKFGESIYWYIDVIIRMLQLAGSSVGNDVWFRVAQILTGFEGADIDTETQRYAVEKILNALNTAHAYEPLVKLGAYVLGEYGDLVADSTKAFMRQYEILARHYGACSAEGQCMVLSAFAKMAARSEAVKREVVELMEGCVSNWDADVQQRATEYLALIRSGEFKEKGEEVLDKVPGFPESFLYNNVILKSLHQLQVKRTKNEKTEVDQDDDSEAKEEVEEVHKKAQAPAAPKDLVDFGETEEKKGSGLEGIFDDAPTVSLRQHAIYKHHTAHFAKEVCADSQKAAPPRIPPANALCFKSLMLSQANEAVLFESETILVKVKSNYNSFMGRCLLQVISKKGIIESIVPEVVFSKGFVTECSKVKYGELESLSAGMFMLQTMISSPSSSPPSIQISYTINQLPHKSQEIALPILLSKFIEQQESTLEVARDAWNALEKYGCNIDALLANPAPSNLSHTQVLMKLAQLLNQVFGFYVVPPEKEISFTSLYALGNLKLKSEEQVKFPSSPSDMKTAVSISVMLQVEMYPHITMEEFRFSVRSINKETSEAILSIFKLFINKP
eukprot:TRINITY_DN10583_c0_g1_i7.p1 TRINITY_DN10583_c0_g1~~TRINITY_DN10583_c0_g1_i7.p1  ORF type:complete len:1028 (+),score=371.74 TRINITY_DN10583_c0_g1_i7:150-3086(+)